MAYSAFLDDCQPSIFSLMLVSIFPILTNEVQPLENMVHISNLTVSNYWNRFQIFLVENQLCILIPLAMTASLLLIIVTIRVSVMFCCTRAQRKKAADKIGSLRKQDSGPMFARLEEFDVLTPLQPTPSVSIQSASVKNYGSASPSVSASTSSGSRQQLIPPLLTSSSSDSPPPPRRPNNGKTFIVPLNASRYRTPLQMTAAGALDSRLTSYECGTTKSCATIPEDDEDETDDLLSIDRTSLSAYEQPSSRYMMYSGYNLSLPTPMPEFQLPAPTYSPPSLPSESPATRPHKFPVSPDDQPSIYEVQSPHSSSASFSDSFYLNNFDAISSAANSQIFETSLCGESDVASKFQLHRIEEESEGGEDLSNGCGAGGGQSNYEFEYEASVHSGSQFFPRSISQQFDMMRQQ